MDEGMNADTCWSFAVSAKQDRHMEQVLQELSSVQKSSEVQTQIRTTAKYQESKEELKYQQSNQESSTRCADSPEKVISTANPPETTASSKKTAKTLMMSRNQGSWKTRSRLGAV